MSFAGKNFLIVGGTSGIGLNIAQRLYEEDANVIVAARNQTEEVQSYGFQFIQVDLLNDDVKEAFKALPETLHGLVYTPGSITLKPFQALKEDQIQSDLNVNVMGAIKATQGALKSLKKGGDASVVFYSTVATQVGMPYHVSVATAKAALEGLGKSLAAELVKSNIRVNVVAPSLTNSPLASNLLSTEEKQQSSNQRHPLGRYGEVKDIAGITQFLLSDDASWITGQVIGVDGGLSGIRSV
jgi:3-oxoacyl-[acyl-carrier protein] reductase